MHIINRENEIINEIKLEAYLKVPPEITLRNCIIGSVDLGANIFPEKVIIENCIINKLDALAVYFEGGCSILNCMIKNEITFEAGGHNVEEVRIEGNIFSCFVNFFDTQFEGSFIFRNNVLLEGSDLLGNEGLSMKTKLGSNPQIDGNIGDLFLDDYIRDE